MFTVEEHYYNIISIFLLKLLGIWPQDKLRLVIILQRTLIVISTVSFICLQLAIFITSKYEMALFVKTMSVAFPFIICTMKYCVFILKSRNINKLHYQIQKDWKKIQNKIESEIMQKYAHYCSYYTILLYLYSSCIAIGVFFMYFHPFILDIISPLDKPRPWKVLFTVEYFTSQDKYIHAKVLHEFIIALICALIILGTGTQLLIFAFHIFGLFKITSHRVRYSIEDNVLDISNFKKERAICRNIIHAVIAHRRAMKFSDIFVSTFNVEYCIIAIVGVFSLSINLFRFLEAIAILKNMEDIIITFLLNVFHLLYMFVANFIGQKVTDYSSEIFTITYGISWYLMPVPTQKLFLFLMRKTCKEFNLRIGLIFVAKIENFSMLLNNALSYVAVMYSIR